MKIVEFVVDNGIRLQDGKYTAQVNDAEQAVQEILEDQGYETKNLNPRSHSVYHSEDIPDDLFNIIHSNFLQSSEFENNTDPLFVTQQMDGKGLPDILAWKEVNGSAICPLFIEVKKNEDAVRVDQIKWMKNNTFVKSGVAYIKDTNFVPEDNNDTESN